MNCSWLDWLLLITKVVKQYTNGKKHQIAKICNRNVGHIFSEDVSPYVLCSRLAGLNLDPHHVASI